MVQSCFEHEYHILTGIINLTNSSVDNIADDKYRFNFFLHYSW